MLLVLLLHVLLLHVRPDGEQVRLDVEVPAAHVDVLDALAAGAAAGMRS